jgi:hypothetical protein
MQKNQKCDSKNSREAYNTNEKLLIAKGPGLERDGCDEYASRRDLIRHILVSSASLAMFPASNSFALEDVETIDAEAEVRALRIASELMRENAALVRKDLSASPAPPEEIDLGYPGTDVRRRRVVLSRVARLSQVAAAKSIARPPSTHQLTHTHTRVC